MNYHKRFNVFYVEIRNMQDENDGSKASSFSISEWVFFTLCIRVIISLSNDACKMY